MDGPPPGERQIPPGNPVTAKSINLRDSKRPRYRIRGLLFLPGTKPEICLGARGMAAAPRLSACLEAIQTPRPTPLPFFQKTARRPPREPFVVAGLTPIKVMVFPVCLLRPEFQWCFLGRAKQGPRMWKAFNNRAESPPFKQGHSRPKTCLIKSLSIGLFLRKKFFGAALFTSPEGRFR